MSAWRLVAVWCLLSLGACASNRSDESGNTRMHPEDSTRASSDTMPYRVRDTVPDSTAIGRRDTIIDR
jgi:hypothetical protein